MSSESKTEQLGSDTRAGFEDWYRRNYKASDTKESMTRKAYDQPIVVISRKIYLDIIDDLITELKDLGHDIEVLNILKERIGNYNKEK